MLPGSLRRPSLVALLVPICCIVLAGDGPAFAPPSTPHHEATRPHPRLFLDAAMRQRLETKAKARDRDWLEVKRDADRLVRAAVLPFERKTLSTEQGIGYAYQGFGWLNAVWSLAIAYQVTHDARYAGKLGELLDAINALTSAGNLDPLGLDSGFPSRTVALAVAVAYDWGHPALDARRRAATIATLNAWFDLHRKSAFDHDGKGYGNYFGGHLLGFGAAAYATLGENPRAPEMVAHVRERWDRVRAAYADGFAGGYPAEGWLYGGQHFIRLLQFAELVRTATGEVLDPQATFARRTITSLLHHLKPDRTHVTDEANWPGDVTGEIDDSLPLYLSHAAAGTPEGAYAQHLVGIVKTKPTGGRRFDAAPAAFRLLYWDPRRRGVDHRTALPTFHHSPGDEHLVMRSSFRDDAVWASVAGGTRVFADHQAWLAGHLAIQRGADYLLVFAGQWKGTSGSSGSPKLFLQSSRLGNTLYLDDAGAYLPGNDRYRGGQSGFGNATRYPFAHGPAFTWARLDLTEAYDHRLDRRNEARRPLRSWVRELAYVAPGTFIVFDRAAFLTSSYPKHLRFHMNASGAPRITGTLATSTVGASTLSLRALAPADAQLALAWEEANGTELVPRIEVHSPGAGEALEALTVLVADERGAAPPPAARIASGDGILVGAHVRTPGSEGVVLFARSPHLQGDVRYELAATKGPIRHHVFGLPPGRGFGVACEPFAGGRARVVLGRPGAGAAVTSDARGALVFDVLGAEVRPGPVSTSGR